MIQYDKINTFKKVKNNNSCLKSKVKGKREPYKNIQVICEYHSSNDNK